MKLIYKAESDNSQCSNYVLHQRGEKKGGGATIMETR